MADVRIDPKEVFNHPWRWKEIPRYSADYSHKTAVAVWTDAHGTHAALLNDRSLTGAASSPMDDPHTTFFVQVDLPAAAKKLMDAQDAAMADPDFQPGAHKAASHCSEATLSIAAAMGADTSPLGARVGGFYQANDQTTRLAKTGATKGGGWKQINLSSAQDLADQGILVVAAWADPDGGHGHTVTVRPDLTNWKEETNPMMAQIGGKTGNGVMPFRNTFGSDKRDAVKFYAYMGS